MRQGNPSAATSSGTTRVMVLAFAPLHKAAFGIAIGIASGLIVFLLTAVLLLRNLEQTIPLHILRSYFRGYSVTWSGALIGAAWGFVAGFVFGWFTAFCRNFVFAVSLFLIRTRAELSQTRDFLDHV